ncbi:hypothetical protein [Burkholderia sp. Ax-1719]|uniref:hypothetical protein n=1 Tax=Burkholderia sp. Ax-1719 TaxID=2608334 RepID=UPI00141E22C0|nr:hypothetical protein [Burkholderia sp. Ax-1719]NIE63156.1 hypothetical protein [Burkholderia sp. Ax-1719]
MSDDLSIVITEDQIDALTEQIKKSVGDTHLLAGGPSEKFCEVWPVASEGLTALKGILGVIPGVSAFAAVAIGIVLAAGNAASNAVCKKGS